MVMFYPLTGFGSALNIETLVAAAEKRETPIEVLVHCSISKHFFQFFEA